MNDVPVPVLIVGAGAAGLTASALLTKHGVRSLVVERRREVFIYPKARNLSFRSLEILRGLGLAEQVHAVADGMSGMLTKTSLSSAETRQAFDVDAIFAPFDGLSPEPSAQYCPQSALEPMLLEYSRGHRNRIRYGTELSSFEQDETGVTAVIRDRDSGARDTVRAEYLIAADGVHSPIRDTLGVPTSGHGALPIYVVFIYFRGPWRQFVPQLGDGDAIHVENDCVKGIFLPVRDDFGMLATTYLPGQGESAEQFTADRCREMLRAAIGEPIDVEIVAATPWQPYERVADRLRCGRVFLVGDSAHAMPPFKGRRCQLRHPECAQSGLEVGGGAERHGRSRATGHLPGRAAPDRAIQRTPVAHGAVGAPAMARRHRSETSRRRGGADVRSAHWSSIPFGRSAFRRSGSDGSRRRVAGEGIARPTRHPGPARVAATRGATGFDS